ncbi:MAG: DUF5946 family protein [Acidobacteriota bacterium]|nr:DUF5946 family protein [Acidobacteriota bacterium]MDH3522806.1 DUF5946 family protein [Acidobacteriota bacterium]
MESPCFSCGAVVADCDGPVHPYMASSPGCWAAFGEVLEREYSAAAYAKNHRLTVDAYAVQHPGEPSPQSVRSVALHLVSLHLVLERGVAHAHATRVLQAASRESPAFYRLVPPASLGTVTVRDVLDGRSAEEHLHAVARWAESAWLAWADWHDQVAAWAQSLLRHGAR